MSVTKDDINTVSGSINKRHYHESEMTPVTQLYVEGLPTGKIFGVTLVRGNTQIRIIATVKQNTTSPSGFRRQTFERVYIRTVMPTLSDDEDNQMPEVLRSYGIDSISFPIRGDKSLEIGKEVEIDDTARYHLGVRSCHYFVNALYIDNRL